MPNSFSIYLETARLTATLIVFLGHGKMFYRPLAEWCEDINPGRDAVIIFFVLSGYVISWCGHTRDKTAVEFGINRAARIYSVAIPALALGLAVSMLASWLQQRPLEYPLHKPWLYLPIYLGFLGNFWFLAEVPPQNFPFWSLNFEVWYYVLFAALWYLRGPLRWLAAGLLMLAVGPVILSLWPIWLAGSALYFLRDRVRMAREVAWPLWLASLLGFGATKLLGLDNLLDAQAITAMMDWSGRRMAEPLLGDYLIGALVVLNFAAAMNLRFTWTPGMEAGIRRLAACSFSLYLFHMPVFELIQLAWAPQESLLAYVVLMLLSAAVISWMARYTEHRKDWYRRTFARWLTRRSR